LEGQRSKVKVGGEVCALLNALLVLTVCGMSQANGLQLVQNVRARRTRVVALHRLQTRSPIHSASSPQKHFIQVGYTQRNLPTSVN